MENQKPWKAPELSLTQKLELAFDFFVQKKKWAAENKKEIDMKLTLLIFFTKLFDFESFPNVLSDQNFESLPTVPLFRGTDKNENHANLLCDFDYHHGYGAACYGIFSSTSKQVAKSYAEGNDKNVMTFKLSGNSIDFEILGDYLSTIGKPEIKYMFDIKNHDDREKLFIVKDFFVKLCERNLPNEELSSFIMNFMLNRSLLAIILGYDAITSNQNTYYQSVLVNDEESPLNVIILNRGAMALKKSEFDRICNASKKYKNGVIDFDKKSEKQFLDE